MMNRTTQVYRQLINTVCASMIYIATLTSIGGCVTATPVTPAPLTPLQTTQLKGALPGTWFWVATKRVGGEKEEVSNLLYDYIRTYTFGADGTVELANTKGTWSLDGANLTTTIALDQSKVEECNTTDLTLFVYGNSTWMYFKRK